MSLPVLLISYNSILYFGPPSVLWVVRSPVFGYTLELQLRLLLSGVSVPDSCTDARYCVRRFESSIEQTRTHVAGVLMHGRSTARGCGLPAPPNLAPFVPKGAVARVRKSSYGWMMGTLS